MIAEYMKTTMLPLALDNFNSIDEVYNRREQNLTDIISRMTEEQKDYWFDGVNVKSTDDLSKIPKRTPEDILNLQLAKPPFGLFTPGPIMSMSSGTTAGVRKLFPRSLDDYYRYTLGNARLLLKYGIDDTDVFSSTDTGGMFLAHISYEEAAMVFCGARRARTSEHSLVKRLEFMGEMGVTVLSATCTKLLRMAKLNPKKYLKRPMKMVMSLGEKLHDAEEIAEAFGVKHVVDSYGAVEFGSIYWTCPAGHKHVNADMLFMENTSDLTYFSNLSSLPVFRYGLGEKLSYSYKGQCECGSHLPTVDAFEIKGPDRSNKVD
jgi:phenylacetate-coenzyme A ligase PaaK-like adenylate-forming protein